LLDPRLPRRAPAGLTAGTTLFSAPRRPDYRRVVPAACLLRI